MPTLNASQTIVQLERQVGDVRLLDNVEMISGNLVHHDYDMA